MNIAVVGTGYVGLVTGTCLAETGNKVICVDIDTEKVKYLQNGKVPIYEPNLETLFERNIKQGRLEFTTDLQMAVSKSQIVFLALPTPTGQDGSADLSSVLRVASELGPLIKNYTIVVDKSTVPVGTAELVTKEISKGCNTDFDVVSNPEFLREGFAVNDFMKPERVIIGSSSEHAKNIMAKLFRPYVRQGNPILFMDERSAELTKYAANSFLAAKISFMNEIANLCEKVGADVDNVRIGMGSDSRIGKRFLFPGIGYGGSCFPKDVAALVKTGEIENSELHILSAVMTANKYQKEILANKILAYYNGNVSGKHFALWGLAFKPDTDDIREAPSLSIIDTLVNKGATITAFDPAAIGNTKKLISDKINFASNQYEALKGANALIIATEWAVFRTPDFIKAKRLLKESVIFDGRNLYELEQLENEGYYYNSIGRKTISKK